MAVLSIRVLDLDDDDGPLWQEDSPVAMLLDLIYRGSIPSRYCLSERNMSGNKVQSSLTVGSPSSRSAIIHLRISRLTGKHQ